MFASARAFVGRAEMGGGGGGGGNGGGGGGGGNNKLKDLAL